MIPKISPCNYNISSYSSKNNSYLNKNISFTSLPCTIDGYTDAYGTHRSTQHTTALRNDLDYNKLAYIVDNYAKHGKNKFQWFLERYFKKLPNTNKTENNLPKVTIYSAAGSDGTEAYAIANAIIKKMGLDNAKKYVFPIKVSDVSEDIIENYGKKGIIYLYDGEIEKLKAIKKYLTPTGNIYDGKIEDLKEYEISKEFRDLFTFETADLQEKIENFPKAEKNELNIVIIRNCLAQAFGSFGTDNILYKIYNHLPLGSLVIFGDYDTKAILPSVFKYPPLGLPLIDYKNNIYTVCSPPEFRDFL